MTDNLLEHIDVFRVGSTYVLVETGQPQDNVLLGFGESLSEAYDDMQPTLIQSLGPDCGLENTLEWAVSEGMLNPDDLEALERVEDARLPEGGDEDVE